MFAFLSSPLTCVNEECCSTTCGTFWHTLLPCILSLGVGWGAWQEDSYINISLFLTPTYIGRGGE